MLVGAFAGGLLHLHAAMWAALALASAVVLTGFAVLPARSTVPKAAARKN